LTDTGYLLRVPKAGTSAFSYEELQEYWEKTVAPLFEDGRLLVKQSLISLKGSGIVPKLNATLAEVGATRRQDFQGSRVADVECGMLVQDMRGRDAHDLVLEFKPKWLSQSPAAPPDATRCRNCAREAYRANKDGKTLGSTGRAPLCPLKLVHLRETACDHEQAGHKGQENPDCEICATAAALLLRSRHSADQSHIAPYKARLAHWIRRNELLPLLRRLQVACDAGLESDRELNMTMRDCTCFVRMSSKPGTPVDARLGDLDRKNGAAKRAYWEEMERKLAEGGYYEGKEVPRQRTTCWLERGLKTQERREAME